MAEKYLGLTKTEIKKRLEGITSKSELTKEIEAYKNDGLDEEFLSKIYDKVMKKIEKEQKIYDAMIDRIVFERKFIDEGDYDYVLGIDEAGRGPLCGPVCAACSMMKLDKLNTDINDSKQLSETKREELYEFIKENTETYGIALIDAKRIDEINILNATFEAMTEAFFEAYNKIPDAKDKKILILVDGNKKVPQLSDFDQIAVVKGDAKSYSIASASILAKVTRDKLLDEKDKEYPEYGFKDHKGYGTAKHIEALKKYGKIEGFHRETFIKNFL